MSASVSPLLLPEVSVKERFPRRFGDRYILLKELGRGGMGQVFMAVTGQTGIQRVCALKIIRDLQAGRDADEMSQRFLDEAKVVTRLSQENLVFVFDFGIVKRQGYLAMEYVRGKTLTDVWNRCAAKSVAFPTGVSLYMISELLAGLSYAHSLEGLNLVHRDVSPSNVMLTYTGGVKLIDFGLAKWKSKLSQTATGINWGKLSYMSPEQHFGKPMDRRSDLYSVAVMLWELLTGRQLFPDEAARQKAHEFVPPSRFNGTLPRGLDAIVQRALSIDADQRYATGQEMGTALATLMPRDATKLHLNEFLRRLFAVDAAAEAAQEAELNAKAAVLLSSTPGERAESRVDSVPQERADDHTANSSISNPLDDPDPIIGSTLADRYYVRRRIGEGAMGRVYEGHHTGIGKRVAIKIPRNAERRKTELFERFRLEANAASRIGHPNIADVTDCGNTASGDFFFVMEFLDGIDLDKLVRREGPLPTERALVIGIQICRALEAAHKVGIIHRDLKPSNVMLLRERSEDFVKVLDFGVAKFLRLDAGSQQTPVMDLTLADAAVGTPRYMAPEQIEAGREIDFRTDIYAVGGLLYYTLSGGNAPFEGESVQAVWRKKVTEDPAPLSRFRSDLPAPLEGLIMSCLAREPEFRPSSMEGLKQALISALEQARAAGSSVLGMRVPSSTALVLDQPTDSNQNRPPRRVLGTFVVGMTAAAVLGLGAILWRTPRRRPPAPPASTLSMPLPSIPPATPSAPRPASGAASGALAAPLPAPKEEPPPPSPQAAAVRPERPGPKMAVTLGHRSKRAPLPPPARIDESPPSLEEDHFQRANQAFNDGSFVTAEMEARRAAAKGGVPAQLLLGTILLQTLKFQDAEVLFEQILKVHPNDAKALEGLSKARQGQGF